MTVHKGLALAGVLLAADLIVKASVSTPQWGWHERTVEWKQEAALTIVVPLVMMVTKVLRVAGVFILAGILGNLISSLTGDVANPLVVGRLAAFNLADCYLWLGVCAAMTAVFLTTYHVYRRRGFAS